MAVWMPSPVSGSMWPAASPIINRWSSKVVFRPWPPSLNAAARILSILAFGPSAALMKGSSLMAPSCNLLRSSSCGNIWISQHTHSPSAGRSVFALGPSSYRESGGWGLMKSYGQRNLRRRSWELFLEQITHLDISTISLFATRYQIVTEVELVVRMSKNCRIAWQGLPLIEADSWIHDNRCEQSETFKKRKCVVQTV